MDDRAVGTRDLNGAPVRPGRLARLRSRLRGGQSARPLTVADADLMVVAGSDDDAIASSSALADSSWQPDAEVVLRHVLRLPPDRVTEAAAVAALDGYTAVHPGQSGSPSVPSVPDTASADGTVHVVFVRVQMLDAMHLSQERSRMASLGSRHGGTAVSWDVLQRPPA